MCVIMSIPKSAFFHPIPSSITPDRLRLPCEAPGTSPVDEEMAAIFSSLQVDSDAVLASYIPGVTSRGNTPEERPTIDKVSQLFSIPTQHKRLRDTEETGESSPKKNCVSAYAH